MINLTKIALNALQITGNAEASNLLLVGMSAGFDYVDGKKTDKQTHIKYEVVCPDNLYEKITVKVAGVKPVIAPEQFEQQKGRIKVRFKNLTGKIYRANSGEYALSASAEGVEVIV